MMLSPKVENGLLKLQKALAALEEMAAAPQQENRGNIDATIQRFEFTFELFWKLLKAVLEVEGVESQFPKEVLKESFQGHLIDHEDIWIRMLKDRNLTSHTYDEKLANLIYGHIRDDYVPLLRTSLDSLEIKLEDLTATQ